MLNASPIKKITDRQQVLNDLLSGKQRSRNDLKLDGKDEEHGARLLRRRTIQIEGKKQSSESDTAPDSANANPQQQKQNLGGSNVDPNSQLNDQPKTEFAPLQPEGGPNAIESASESEEDQDDQKTKGEQEPPTKEQSAEQNEQGTKPPPANEQTAEQLQQEKAAATQKQTETNQAQRTQNSQMPGAQNNQIAALQKEIAALQKKRAEIIEAANKALKKKIRKEWTKLFATGFTVIMIFYYLAKIKIIKMIYSREPREAKNIQKQIEAKNKEIKKLKRAKLLNRLLSPLGSARS